MFKTTQLSDNDDDDFSSDDDFATASSNIDEINSFSFTDCNNISQINDSTSSSKSGDDAVNSEEGISEGTSDFDTVPANSTTYSKKVYKIQNCGRDKKRQLKEEYNYSGIPQKRKPDYVFDDSLTNLGSSTSKPIHHDNKGRSLLEKMGYIPGKGLGKHAQGIVEPVEVSKQKGRRGLGLSIPGLEPADLEWDSSYEVIEENEEVNWLRHEKYPLETIDLKTLQSWKREGPKDMDLENMTDFCDRKLLKNLLSEKSKFDNLKPEELRKARSRSNPFESIRSGMFLNRAAMKMANMDARLDFMFTNPQYGNGRPMVQPNELLYFADVCAGPGGFSEYILWRKKWQAKGFGFTLKGDCDFKLSDFLAGSPETFEPYYGVKDDGNVFDPENIRSFTEVVMNGTENRGVHFMMADGGFSVDGQENYQEILSKRLYLCQCLVALSIVRDEGHFVCKLFDIFTPFSAGIVYLMYRAFEEICIFKPNTSRPANSERYLICKFKRSDSTQIRDYMFMLCERLWEIDSSDDIDIIQVVDMEVLLRDDDFIHYLINSNNRLGERQLVNVKKIVAFSRDSKLVEEQQIELRKKCLANWQIPDKPRLADRTLPMDAAKKAGFLDKSFFSEKIMKLKSENFSSFISLHDWHCIPLGSEEPRLNLYLGLGRNKIYRWSPNNSQWIRDVDCKAELPPGTLIYAEAVSELLGEGKSRKHRTALHVIDAIALGYQIISKYHYNDRIEKMNLLAKALKKHDYKDRWPIRIKLSTPMVDLVEIFKALTIRYSKNNDRQLILEYPEYSFQPKGILFLNSTREPWMRCKSKQTQHYYYYNTLTRHSLYGGPEDTIASTLKCIEKLLLWKWVTGVGLENEKPVEGVVHKDELLEFINKKLSA